MSKARDIARAGTALANVDATELGYLDGVTSSVQTQLDAKAIPANVVNNSLVDAKGDLLTATADNTPARLAVGSNGFTLVADSSTSTGLAYSPTFFAGKNKIINGDFGIWQRGTSFTNPVGDSYTADRFMIDYGTAAPTSNSITRQTFTPGSAPVAEYEGAYFFRSTLTTVGTTSRLSIHQKIEDVRTFAGQTVTLSFWAKADSARTLAGFIQQNFGSGGSTTVSTAITSQSLTTSWTRFSMQISVPSVSGKTIGTSSFLNIRLDQAVAAGSVLELWGLQLEAGSVATVFQTATGTVQSELAACQRYYQRRYGKGNGTPFGAGQCYSTTAAIISLPFPVTLRTTPSLASNGLYITNSTFGSAGGTIAIYSQTSSDTYAAIATSASGLVAGNATLLVGTDANSYLELSAEL